MKWTSGFRPGDRVRRENGDEFTVLYDVPIYRLVKLVGAPYIAGTCVYLAPEALTRIDDNETSP